MTSSLLTATGDPSPPEASLKLIFIHHSCGESWLADHAGGLGIALRDNGYFVSDTKYGWGPVCENCWGAIGDCTDILHWDNWFDVDGDAAVFQQLLNEYGQQCDYSRRDDRQPTSENDIILFKSCYPNSNLAGRPDDAASPGRTLTVGSAKAVYTGLLDQFSMQLDKLFVAITAPPATQGDSWENPENARAFNNWLVHDWLADYPRANVAVFDFYNVLTSNGGNGLTNGSGQETGNQHRWWSDGIQHIQTVDSDLSAFSDGNSHPTSAGNRKATEQFIPLLNVFVNRWLEESQ